MSSASSRKILPLPELIKDLNHHRRKKNKIIFAHGVFDLLHRGHVTLLSEAKKLDGILVVGVENDENVKKLKGNDRPIHSQEARLYVLSHLEPIDYLFLIPQYQLQDMNAFYTDIYKQLRADVLATCVEAGRYGLLKKDHAKDAGMDFVNIPECYERNTTKVIEILSQANK